MNIFDFRNMVKFTHLIYKESTRNAMHSMYSKKFLKSSIKPRRNLFPVIGNVANRFFVFIFMFIKFINITSHS